MGVTLARSNPLDFRQGDTHPLEAYYRVGRYQSVLIDVPVSRLRGLASAAFPCTRDSGHPFIETLMEYESGTVQCYTASALERFYQRWQPRNAAEYLGVGDDSEHARLRELTPIESVFPWSRNDPQIQRKNVSYAVDQGCVSRHDQIMRTREFWHLVGPATEESGSHEYMRLVSTYNSIKNKGYRRRDAADGDIRGTLMLRGDDWCVLIGGGGQHRSSAVSALGSTAATVRLFYHLPMIVRREECGYWPHVQAGLFGKNVALKVFDRIFSGRPPW